MLNAKLINKDINSYSLRNLLTHIAEREFDADKHCGVWIADLQKQCTRSLTCKVSELLNFSDSFWIVTGSIVETCIDKIQQQLNL